MARSTPTTLAATLADLTNVVRRTTGDVPPPLVGASLTVIDSTAYVFGGRLVPTRTMVDTLYALALDTLVWTRLWPPADVRVRIHDGTEGMEELEDASGEATLRGPRPCYFHAAEAYGDLLIIFGGMGYSLPNSRSQSPAGSINSRASANSRGSKRSGKEQQRDDEPADQGLCVLNDLVIFDTRTKTWSFPNPAVVSSTGAPAPSGSPNPTNSPGPGAGPAPPSPSPRYAHLSCIANNCLVIIGGQDLQNRYLQEISVLDLERMVWVETRRYDGHCGTYRSVAVSRPLSVHYPTDAATKRNSVSSVASARSASESAIGADLLQLPYSAAPTRENPEPIFLYSNFNFSSVRRALDLVAAPKAPTYACAVTPLSHLMSSGPALPPGLRFPTGAVVGGHLVVAGTFLSHSLSTFAIWSLDLANYSRGGKLTWAKIDPGGMMSGGASWNKAAYWRNSMIVLGDRDRSIADDYDHRQTNYVHCAFIDLEAFGIYQPPVRLVPPVAQDLGLSTLSISAFHDFEIVCADGVRVGCSRKLLEDRWPWLRDRLADYRVVARGALATYERQSTNDGVTANGIVASDADVPDVRVTARTLHLPESSAVARAALEFIYAQAICTPHQHQPAVLVSLLIFARAYRVPNLFPLVTHALHSILNDPSPNAPAQIYEAATLAGALALQIRSLKLLMNASREARRQAARAQAQRGLVGAAQGGD